MFITARKKLTLWYLLIIMVISSAFSMVIYRGINIELSRIAQRQSVRVERDFGIRPTPQLNMEVLEESRVRVIRLLFFVNATILVVAGVGGYYLAGKTLEPIEEMLQTQKDFIANASHDLKTPITALRTNIEVVLRDNNLTEDDLKKQLSDNLADVIRLQNLTENLLSLSDKRTKQEKEIASINQLLEQAIKEVSPLTVGKNIKIIRSLKNDYFVSADTLRLQRAIVAILDNAIKYSLESGAVKVETHKQARNVLITITDNGIGINEKDLKRVKERFYRADNSRSSSGHGLGLPIAERIIHDQAGTLDISSKAGFGTTIRVSLPLSAKIQRKQA